MKFIKLIHEEIVNEETVIDENHPHYKEAMNKETLSQFQTEDLLRSGEHGFVSNLIKSRMFSEIPEQEQLSILQGGTYIRKKVTTEYFIVNNDNIDRTDKFNCGYFTGEQGFYQLGDSILNQEEYDEHLEWKSKTKNNMEYTKGKLYQSNHVETVDGLPTVYTVVLLCTGEGDEPNWGNYKTVAGVVVSNNCPTSGINVGDQSTTWNSSQFDEEYLGLVGLCNINYKPPMGVSQG